MHDQPRVVDVSAVGDGVGHGVARPRQLRGGHRPIGLPGVRALREEVVRQLRPGREAADADHVLQCEGHQRCANLGWAAAGGNCARRPSAAEGEGLDEAAAHDPRRRPVVAKGRLVGHSAALGVIWRADVAGRHLQADGAVRAAAEALRCGQCPLDQKRRPSWVRRKEGRLAQRRVGGLDALHVLPALRHVGAGAVKPEGRQVHLAHDPDPKHLHRHTVPDSFEEAREEGGGGGGEDLRTRHLEETFRELTGLRGRAQQLL
mmetsp:Transcript_33169/g.96745  ORF Transcript_33169/g.96745 Transcript_33169/m.96745 type:complete len:261 (-) Transcript_33169:505-1287(-)